MTTVWLAVNEKTEEIKVHRFAETARNTVFEWVKADLLSEMAALPKDEEICWDDFMDEVNELVIQAEESPWLSRYQITEAIVEE